MKTWIKNCLYIILAIIVVGLCFVPFIWNECFFGQKITIAETLKYIGAFIGGILLAVNAFFIYKRVKEQNRNNNLVAKGQLDTRFKDAATLLAAGNTSAELSGIHALHQIAVEASQTKDQQDYVKVIKEILIAFIKDNSVIEYKKDEDGHKLFDKFRKPIIEEAHNNEKNRIVLQTIIDKLFRDSTCKIYAKYPTDLSGTVLVKMDFSDAKLQKAVFRGAQLQFAEFSRAQLQGAVFYEANLQRAVFFEANLQDTDFSWANIMADRGYFSNTFWNKKTNFKGTAFENKTEKELTEIMENPPTP